MTCMSRELWERGEKEDKVEASSYLALATAASSLFSFSVKREREYLRIDIDRTETNRRIREQIK